MHARGFHLLPHLLDSLAQETPFRVWASVPNHDISQWHDITVSTIARAIDRMAWWVQKQLGQPAPSSQPAVAYIGPADVIYLVVLFALLKAGYTPLFPSHQNTPSNNDHLLKAASCEVALCGSSGTSVLSLNLAHVREVAAPALDELLSDKPVAHFPYDRNYDEACRENFLILHTSGSTGMPKLIVWTHESIAANEARRNTPPYQGVETEEHFRKGASRILLGPPPFHASGILSTIILSVLGQSAVVFPPASRPIDAELVRTMISNANVDAAALLPHVVEDIVHSPSVLDKMTQLKYISFVGGPVTKATGDTISKYTFVCPMWSVPFESINHPWHRSLVSGYGSTEVGYIQMLHKSDPADWEYLYFYPGRDGIVMRPLPDQSGLSEMLIKRDSSQRQQVFSLFPHLQEWPMKDVFEPHPKREHHWRLVGRADDLIVLSSGAKMFPHAMEHAVLGASCVRDALVGGQGRPQCFLLVEPKEPGLGARDHAARQALLDSIWPVIEAENARLGNHAQVLKELILVASEDRPFPRTSKMTVQRKAALKLYEKDIEAAYSRLSSEFKKIEDDQIESRT